ERMRNAGENPRLEPIAKAAHFIVTFRFARELTSGAQSQDVRHCRSAPTPATFLRAADDKRRQLESLANVKRTNTLWRMQLVAGQSKQIDVQFLQVNGNLAHRLYAVNVKDCIRIPAHNLANLFNRKEHARFIVCEHHRNNARIATQRVTQIVQVELAVTINFQPGYFITNLTQMFTKVSNGFVLNSGCDDVTLVWILLKKAADGPIVGFRTARSKNDLA